MVPVFFAASKTQELPSLEEADDLWQKKSVAGVRYDPEAFREWPLPSL